MFPDFQRARRGLKLCSRLVIKHDLVSNSSVLLSLIFDDTLYFSFCAPFHLFKRCDVIGRTAITMTDGFPGGRSAVAKMISGGEGGDSRRFQRAQMWGDANGLSWVQRACVGFFLCSLCDGGGSSIGTLACVYNICLTFWSWHTHTHTLMQMQETDEVRW